eukprot:CAMPEP_0181187580 /NCGR_PEP_ID=MMETSP1096-20121128/10649_1 /TAXON_ID=156174 ORGANISM="Chrysochromulina ericina, Strain CCMP281" /NCGR_SAMPLE_ID=MMETSP1096 /ASSEMBLY_ACC=CAM_ASM_000453 /LENGTH=41 /DNA_ID= /DNA_START= /DNA_END= /DNA_ORIENTATION=
MEDAGSVTTGASTARCGNGAKVRVCATAAETLSAARASASA